MKTNEEKKIETVIEQGLEAPVMDLSIDYAELALDSFLDNEALKEIPIVKTAVGLVKGGLKIKEIFFAKKLLTFLKQYHAGKLSEDKKKEFQIQFNDNKKYRDSVVQQIMVLNERFLEVEKSKILANLFAAHVNDKFSWTAFCDLSVCLDNLHLRGIQLLYDLEKKETPFYEGFNQGSEEESLLLGAGIISRWGTHLQINAHGQYLFYYGIKGDIDFEFPKKQENT